MLNEYATLPVKNPALSGFIALVSGSIFLTLFLLFYKRNLRKKSLQSLARYNASGSFDLISLSITALVVGYLLRFVLVYVPVLGVLTGQLAGGAFSFACGIAAQLWKK